MENAAFPGEQTLHAAEAWENDGSQRYIAPRCNAGHYLPAECELLWTTA